MSHPDLQGAEHTPVTSLKENMKTDTTAVCLPALRTFFPSLPWWRMAVGGALWPWRHRSSLAPPPSWSNIHTWKKNSWLLLLTFPSIKINTHKSLMFVCLTLMALSAPLVTNSGSPCRKVAAATAVLWACLCWAASWRRSRSQNAMCPWGLPDATMGGPSEGGSDWLLINWWWTEWLINDSDQILITEKSKDPGSDQSRPADLGQVSGVKGHRRDDHLYLFWKRASWLVPSPAWSSSVSRPIGCCGWWCGPLPYRCRPRPPRDSGRWSLY